MIVGVGMGVVVAWGVDDVANYTVKWFVLRWFCSWCDIHDVVAADTAARLR